MLYLPGVLLLSAGLLLLGVATIRAQLLPRWCGWALIASLLGLALIERGSGFVVGLVWVALGFFFSARSRSASARCSCSPACPPAPMA